MATTKSDLVDILDQAFNILNDSKAAYGVDKTVYITTPVFNSIVGFLINERKNNILNG